ncbi:LAQU0S03e02674g1_1 [Lachancea quebecensis]|uniref:U4/U6 snRNA-associated-splicing factor PRP24 n=1 Tax=Lachancea quebecensis TaxID=1654605 RepID=A0A0P1KNN8_9SACH|nr:LAQU0S03e02674g1_1 [Lachancea quebecensis]
MSADELSEPHLKRRLSETSNTEEASSGKKPRAEPKKYREYTTVIVRNLPQSYNFHKVRKLFNNCGKVGHVDVNVSADGRFKVARVEFENYSDVLSALTKSSKVVGGNEIEVEELRESTLWATNFPPTYNQDRLKQLFGQFGGTVLSVRLPSLRFDSRRRFAYVDMASKQEASVALEKLDGVKVENYKLVVKLSQPSNAVARTDRAVIERRQVLVRNLNYKTNEAALATMFAKFGQVEQINIPRAQEQKHQENDIDEKPTGILNDGFAFVTFSDAACAHASLSLNGAEVDSRALDVTLADRKPYLERQEVKHIMASKNQDGCVLGIYPLSDKVPTLQIRRFIIEQAKVKEEDMKTIYLVPDHEGALVVARNGPTAAKISLAIHGSLFNKKTIFCCSPRELQRHKLDRSSRNNSKQRSLKNAEVAEAPSNVTPSEDGKKMNNEDFRKLFLGA